jgi:hypothetical protein
LAPVQGLEYPAPEAFLEEEEVQRREPLPGPILQQPAVRSSHWKNKYRRQCQ